MDQNRATEILAQGYTCAESVLMAVSQEYEMEIEDPHLAMGFGGGMGLMGEVCGAVSGAVMAISLVKGPAGNEQEFQDIMSLVRDLRSRFESEMGTASCRDLTGADLAAPGGLEKLIESGKSEKVCVPAVDTAYRLVMDVLKNAQ